MRSLENHLQIQTPRKKKKELATYVRSELQHNLKWKSGDGRILVVEIQMEERKVLIVNIYTHNPPQGKYYAGLHQKLKEFGEMNLFVCGDFNVVYDNWIENEQEEVEEEAFYLSKTF